MHKNSILRRKICINLILILIIKLLLLGTIQPIYAKPTLEIVEIHPAENIVQYKKQRIYIKFQETNNQDFWGKLRIKFYNTNAQAYYTDPKELTVLANKTAYLFWDISFPIAGILHPLIIIDKAKTRKEFIPNLKNTTLYINVFHDNDKDGIPNITDPDDDNDGLPDEQEKQLGTNPYSPDTDKDGIPDASDIFPTNPKEWQDTDRDGIGDNEDPDIDGDGLPNQLEKQLNTDPYKQDSDGDNYTDKREVKSHSDPNNPKSTPTPIPNPHPPTLKQKSRKLQLILLRPISIKKFIQKAIYNLPLLHRRRKSPKPHTKQDTSPNKIPTNSPTMNASSPINPPKPGDDNNNVMKSPQNITHIPDISKRNKIIVNIYFLVFFFILILLIHLKKKTENNK